MSEALKIARGFSLPLDLVTEATAIVATRGAGKSSASAVLVEEAFGLGVQSVVFDRTGVYWGLRSNAKGDGAGLPIYVLGGPHGDAPLEPHAGSMIADLVVDSGHSFVLDLSDFSKAGAVKFAADFLERLYDRKARSRTTTLLVMDEAHFYAPQTPRGGFKGDSARLMGAMEDVVGLGRSRGLGVVLTTQRTQALNKAILDLIETLLVMRMLSPRARDAVQDWIREKQEDDREGVIASLDSLPTGTAWVWSPLRGILQRVALRRIRTFDSYATPKPGEAQVEPTARKELDLDALGEQMRATAERAKENDPSELRKRVRQLENELAKKPEVDEGFVAWADERIKELEAREPERVEVSVLTDEDRSLLGKLEVLAPSVATAVRDLEELRSLIERAEKASREASPPVVPETPKAVRTVSRGPDRESGGPVREVSLNGDEPLSGPEQRVLDSLAWFEAMRVTAPSRIQVGFVAGYKVSKKGGGTFAQVIADMTKKGLIEQRPGALMLTPEGRGQANDPGLPATNGAMQRAVLDRLSESEARLLAVLIEEHPDDISRIDLGTRCGYAVTAKGGGTFAQLIANLVTLGLVEKSRPGHVRALDVLFPLG